MNCEKCKSFRVCRAIESIERGFKIVVQKEFCKVYISWDKLDKKKMKVIEGYFDELYEFIASHCHYYAE